MIRLKNGKIGKYLGAWHIIEDNYSSKFVTNLLAHNLTVSIMTKRCYLVETDDDIIYSSSITIKRIEEKKEESLSSVKSYLEEKVKKVVKYHHFWHLADKEFRSLNIGWNDNKRKPIYEKYGLGENGYSLIGEKQIPYSWKRLVFISDKKLTKDDLKELVKKDIKEFI